MSILLKDIVVNNKKTCVFIENDIIKSLAAKSTQSADQIIDCNGLTLLTAFFDMHTHLREPGFEYKEDIQSGCEAAVAGGYSAVCCMPNTNPTIDNKYIAQYVIQRAKQVDLAKVYPIGAVTLGLKGENMAGIGVMRQAGVVAISDDGQPVSSSQMMRLTMEYAKAFDMTVISHCEEKDMVCGGVVNEGKVAGEIGLKGIPSACEDIMISRDMILAQMLDAKIHIAHVSTKSGVQLIREAKARGVKVTCETCPHYIAGTEDLVRGFNTMAKVNPPLRSEEDRIAIINGLIDGTIDVISTDHAPHAMHEKQEDINNAPFGISGLETAFALCHTVLVEGGYMTLEQLNKKMSGGAAILGLPSAKLEEDGLADLVVVDTKESYVINSQDFKSKGKNTPFDGLKVKGRVKLTIVGGQIKYQA